MKFEIKERIKGSGDWEIYHRGDDQLCLNGDVIGYCAKIDHKSFEILDIKICDKALRKKGYGTIFVKMYEDMAKKRGFTQMIAKVFKGNIKGINFWENHVNWTKNREYKDQWIFIKNL